MPCEVVAIVLTVLFTYFEFAIAQGNVTAGLAPCAVSAFRLLPGSGPPSTNVIVEDQMLQQRLRVFWVL